MTRDSVGLEFRTELRPGDIGRIVELHGEQYAQEYGWSIVFEAYVAEGIGRFVRAMDPGRDRIWIADSSDGIAGCIAIRAEGDHAQLRYFVVARERRGAGLGRKLFDEAMNYCRQLGFARVYLWTAVGLEAAAHLYRSAGFRLLEEVPEERWGPGVRRQKLELEL